MTEFVVIISLMGAGLKIDRPLSWQNWNDHMASACHLDALTIVAIAFLGWSFLGLGLASALLLGSALAPTDPVLASDIQVGPPQSGEEGEVRFSLTSGSGSQRRVEFPLRASSHRCCARNPNGASRGSATGCSSMWFGGSPQVSG
ncbi:cation:proton antiporter [Phyllobacterium zundukense]|uniref:cation:proton antiporter domain-containing protein n=1 Tax=Phyllobacterium zundukense TaxID=1867719 RepID=UPI001F01EA71|nr:cation:proton antiporter [Phyllobacterium zundukense]